MTTSTAQLSPPSLIHTSSRKVLLFAKQVFASRKEAVLTVDKTMSKEVIY